MMKHYFEDVWAAQKLVLQEYPANRINHATREGRITFPDIEGLEIENV